MRKKVVSAMSSIMLCMPAAFSTAAHAQNRQNPDAIFSEPRGQGIYQLLLGLGDLILLNVVYPKLPSGTALTEVENRILSIGQSTSMTETQKHAALQDAYSDLAKARIDAARTLEKGVGAAVFKSLRIVGTTLILVDVAERAWVWTALNANPTWSPVVTTLRHTGDKLSTQNALPER